MNRREFIGRTLAASVATALPTEAAQSAGTIPKRKLGRTGERLSIIGMGGIVVVGSPQNEADRIVREAIGRGVNYFDVAPTYGNGEAEEKLGNALAGYRDKVFLACKTTMRDREGARKELETSLSRLRTDHRCYSARRVPPLRDGAVDCRQVQTAWEERTRTVAGKSRRAAANLSIPTKCSARRSRNPMIAAR